MDADVGDIVRILHGYRPSALDDLRAAFPASAPRFEPRGLTLGDSEDKALFAAAEQMLESVNEIADEAAASLFKKLRLSRKLELGGSLLALFSSAGVVSALAQWIDDKLALPLALLSFAGGAVPVMVSWLRGTDGGGSAAEALVRLRELVWDARVLQAKLKQSAADVQTIEAANNLARDLAKTLETLGYAAKVRPV